MRAKKTDLARALVRDIGFSIGIVASALEVSRSNLYERPCASPGKRGSYTKLADCDLLSIIIEIVDKRPTYGYRRVCAALNRKLEEQGKPVVNHKRVVRLMKLHGLLLTRFYQSRESRAHTGRIITRASDERWCSDGFELKGLKWLSPRQFRNRVQESESFPGAACDISCKSKTNARPRNTRRVQACVCEAIWQKICKRRIENFPGDRKKISYTSVRLNRGNSNAIGHLSQWKTDLCGCLSVLLTDYQAESVTPVM